MTQAKIKSNTIPLPVTLSTSTCCSTTEDGAAICIVPENGKLSSYGCHSSNQEEGGTASDSGKLYQETNVGSKIRSGVLFMVACLTSPCCTPLYVPLLFVLLAGTPAAVWLSANVGWVYGGLTLISIISFVLAFRWWSKFSGKQKRQTAVSVEPQSLANPN
ncbi:MAG: hypothetical protein IAF02_03835 [Anaerolineae bacterium]|nr:hypothetical protein [Anaerolineae bacterium]